MFAKILVPTDGSALGNIAALEGIKTAAKLGAEVIGINVAREFQSGFGQINDAAVAADEHKCDMIFIGSHGCADWDHVLMGNVSNKVTPLPKSPYWSTASRKRKCRTPSSTPMKTSSRQPDRNPCKSKQRLGTTKMKKGSAFLPTL